MNFIYCYDEPTKDKLIENGYDFMNETNYKGNKAYLFMNNGNKINFTTENIEFSNKMYC